VWRHFEPNRGPQNSGGAPSGPGETIKLLWVLPMALGVVWPFLYLVWGAPFLAPVAAATVGCATAAYLLALRRRQNDRVALQALFPAMLFFVSLNIYFTGGIGSPVVFWLLPMPLGALLWADRRTCAYWSVAILAEILVLFALQRSGRDLPNLIPPESRPLATYLGLSTVIMTVPPLLAAHEAWRQRAIEALAAERTELAASQKRFLDLFANVELVAVVIDRQGRVTFCNAYFLNLAGYRRAWRVHEENARALASFLSRAAAGRVRTPPAPEEPPTACARPAADAWLRCHDLLLPQGRRRGGSLGAQARAPDLAGRVAGGREQSDRIPRRHEPRLHMRLTAGGGPFHAAPVRRPGTP